MSSAHQHQTPHASLPSARRLTLALLVPAVLLTALGMLLLWPHDTPSPVGPADGPARVSGEVLAVSPEPCPPAPEDEEDQVPGAPDAICGTVTVRLISGSEAGSQVTTDIPFMERLSKDRKKDG